MTKPENISIVYMGTPDFAVNALKMLVDARYNVKAVVTQPDKPTGRKQHITPSPVKQIAQSYNIPVLQPEKVKKNIDFIEQIRELSPDLLIVAAYGNILPKKLLEIPRFGAINIHGSLLPKYRGASPIQCALLNGESRTGVTIMLMDEGMDTGDMLLKKEIPITDNDTSQTIHDSLAQLGAEALLKTIPGYLSGEIKAQNQNDNEATYCGLISKQDGQIDWDQEDAKSIYNKWQAYTPWPGIYTFLNNKRVKLLTLKKVDSTLLPPTRQLAPGTLYVQDELLYAYCKSSTRLRIDTLQIEGKKPIDSIDFIHSNKEKLESNIFQFETKKEAS